MRILLYPWFFIFIPFSFVGGLTELVVLISYGIATGDWTQWELVHKQHVVTGGPFGTLFLGIWRMIYLPFEFAYECYFIWKYIFGNLLIHLLMFFWYDFQVFGITLKWCFDASLVIFSNFYNSAQLSAFFYEYYMRDHHWEYFSMIFTGPLVYIYMIFYYVFIWYPDDGYEAMVI